VNEREEEDMKRRKRGRMIQRMCGRWKIRRRIRKRKENSYLLCVYTITVSFRKASVRKKILPNALGPNGIYVVNPFHPTLSILFITTIFPVLTLCHGLTNNILGCESMA
jgi:hypothetical protein